MTKTIRGVKGLFRLILPGHTSTPLREAETMEEHKWLFSLSFSPAPPPLPSLFLRLMLAGFSCRSDSPVHWCIGHKAVGSPASLINEDDAPQTNVQTDLMKGIFQWRLPLCRCLKVVSGWTSEPMACGWHPIHKRGEFCFFLSNQMPLLSCFTRSNLQQMAKQRWEAKKSN